MYLVSACLCGINCKYNGGNNLNIDCLKLLKDKEAILICPEQLGGLTTPRDPSEILKDSDERQEGKVVTKKGLDVTKNFIKGAEEVLKIARETKISAAILKEGSPSCGCNFVYDGNFCGNKIRGEGITCKMLREKGINVISDEEYSRKIKENSKLIFLSDYKREENEEKSAGNVVYNLINSDNEEITDLPPRVEKQMKKLMVLMSEEILGLEDINDIAESTGLTIEEVKELIDKKE